MIEIEQCLCKSVIVNEHEGSWITARLALCTSDPSDFPLGHNSRWIAVYNLCISVLFPLTLQIHSAGRRILCGWMKFLTRNIPCYMYVMHPYISVFGKIAMISYVKRNSTLEMASSCSFIAWCAFNIWIVCKCSLCLLQYLRVFVCLVELSFQRLCAKTNT